MALSDTDAEFLRKVAARCDPFAPLPEGSELYVPFDKIADEQGFPVRGEDAAQALAGHITLSRGAATTQLFAGFRGAGKSTELRRCRALLEAAGFDVLLQDAEQYTNLTTPIDIGDFLFSLALALEDGAIALLPDGKPPTRPFVERVRDFFKRRRIAVEGFDVGLDLPGVRATLKGSIQRDPVFRGRLQAHLRGLVYELHEEFSAFVTDIVTWVRSERAERRGLVFILDGIDHVRGVGDERQRVQASIETLFGQFGSFLKIPSVHTLYTVPTYLPFLNPALREPFGVASVKLLAMTKTHRHESARPDYESGRAALRDFLARRIGEPERLFGPAAEAALQRIVGECGGYLRDMLTILRGVVERAWMHATLPVPARFVDQAVRQLQDGYLRTLTPDDAAALRSVADTFSLEAIDAKYRPRLAELFETHVTLCYTNDGEWYDVHPLVRERVTRPTP